MENEKFHCDRGYLDFNDIIVLDLEQSPIQNGLRNYEFLTVAGFKGGEIYVTLKFK